MAKRADWSLPLPQALVIPTVITLKTLADVRELLRHLPEDRRARPTWWHVAAELDKAAAGADPADVSIALCMALMLEGVECRVQ
jgi:hypothetical protein